MTKRRSSRVAPHEQVHLIAKPISSIREMLSLDLRSLACFRIALGIVIIADLCVRALDLTIHYTDEGILPRAVLIDQVSGPWDFSFHIVTGTTLGQEILFVLAGVIATSMIFGYRTRLSTLLSWIFLVSLQNRNPLVLNAGDVILRLLLFWGMFLPLGATYSLDAAMNRENKPGRNDYFSAAGIALVLQIAFIYSFAALLKTGPEWHSEGSAIYYALSIDQMVVPFGIWLRQFAGFLKGLTHLVWYFELLGPCLLFVPWRFVGIRTIAILGFALMHVGFALTLALGVFPWVCIVGLLALLPTGLWDVVQRKVTSKKLPQPSIYLDDNCHFCKKAVCIIKEFLFIPDLSTQAAQQNPFIEKAMQKKRSWVIVDEKGGRHFEWDAFTVLCESSPVFWPLAPVLRFPVITTVGPFLYRLVSRRRWFWGRVTGFALPYRKDRFTPLRTTQLVAVFFIVYIFVWNLTTIASLRLSIPDSVIWIGQLLRLDQSWDMFSPAPLKDDGWYVIPGKLESGTPVNVKDFEEKEVDWQKPPLISGTFSSERTQKYLMNLWLGRNAKYRLQYGQYLCRQWNADRLPRHRLRDFVIYFMREDSTLMGKAPPVKVPVWEQHCLQ